MTPSEKSFDLDTLIDRALHWEGGLQPAPYTLREVVALRIRYAKLRDGERKRFRGALALLIAGATSSFAVVGGAALYAMAQPATALGLPGAGALEYHVARWVTVWNDVRAEAVPYLGAALALGVLFLAGLPLGKRLING